MAMDEITSVVEGFINKLKDAARRKNPPKDEHDADEKCPEPRRRKDEKDSGGRCPKKRRQNGYSPIDGFKERIERALHGQNAAREIMDAVWQLLRDLGIDIPYREPKRK